MAVAVFAAVAAAKHKIEKEKNIDRASAVYAGAELPAAGDSGDTDLEQKIAQGRRGNRLHGFDFIESNQMLMPGDYVDVRISFPNGADYVVLSRKCIEDLYDGNTVLLVAEDELLAMSSADRDSNQYTDCRVYAVKYTQDSSGASERDYPVNAAVLKRYGWDPNVQENSYGSSLLKYADKRSELEKSMESWCQN